MIWKVAFLNDDGGEAFEGFGNHILDEFLFLLAGGTRGIEKILESTAFESEGGEAEDFGESLVVEGLHDDADTASDTEFVGHEMGSAHGGVVTTRGGDGI